MDTEVGDFCEGLEEEGGEGTRSGKEVDELFPFHVNVFFEGSLFLRGG